MNERLTIRTDGVELQGVLTVPEKAEGLVIFSHGSGSSRFSPRNNFVAQQLHRKRLATFLFDLLTKQEDDIYSNRFDIPLLAKRLADITQQVTKESSVEGLPVGYFGASTGAASAIVAATLLPEDISALVSRGGRPDLAGQSLRALHAPTLLIVGGLDSQVISLNKLAMEEMNGIKAMEIIEGATHLFEEPGTLEQVAALSAEWFVRYVSGTHGTKEAPQQWPKEQDPAGKTRFL